MTEATPQERLIAALARLLEGCRHIAVGAASPIPGAAALLHRAHARCAVTVNVLGSLANNSFTDGSVELFDCAGQGRLDAFFLGGGQIDGGANLNLVGAGADYPASDVRWPGSFGSAYLYYVVPKVILFREEHSRRVLVERVDFVSAPGASPPGVYRPGGPRHLVTGMARFDFQRELARFSLASVHAGFTVDDVLENTGFGFDRPAKVPTTAAPDAATLASLRGPVRDQIAEIYPRFAARAFAG